MHRVAIPVTDGVGIFELAIACEVFGPHPGLTADWWYDLAVCTVRPGPVRTAEGLLVDGRAGLRQLERADTVVVPTGPSTRAEPPPQLLRALRTAHRRGARIASLCTGAFTLAAAGLLDGRTVTTHWMHAAELAARYPAVRVEPNVLYTGDERILTSAGSSAGLDLCLHMVRTDHGSRVANTLARRLVIPPHRDGGQAQYLKQPLPVEAAAGLGPCLDWARQHLERPLAVADLAATALLSERTFARRFRETTGTTPLRWLCAERVRRAEDLLENTEETVERIAARCGFGSAQSLRTHFARIHRVSPLEFRRTFRGEDAA